MHTFESEPLGCEDVGKGDVKQASVSCWPHHQRTFVVALEKVVEAFLGSKAHISIKATADTAPRSVPITFTKAD